MQFLQLAQLIEFNTQFKSMQFFKFNTIAKNLKQFLKILTQILKTLTQFLKFGSD